MTIHERIASLRQFISEELSPLIDHDYVYLEIPFYVNPGDTLIWKGTEDFLKHLPYKCLYKASALTYEEGNIPEGAIIILQGGGNFGDLYRIIQDFRNRIIQSNLDHKIIIFPQTVHYQGYRHLVQDKAIHRKHQNLHICARDSRSYQFLKWQGFSKHVHLVPDMAFFIDQDYLKSLSLPSTGKELLFRRTDIEFREDSSSRDFGNTDVSDWTLYTNPDQVVNLLNTMIWGKPKAEAQSINDYLLNVFFPHQIRTAVELISQYKKTYCTRLHAAILSILLEKDVVILDNSYGKNSHFYDTWLVETDGVTIGERMHCLNPKRAVRMLAAAITR